jgi:hypothetical protein
MAWVDAANLPHRAMPAAWSGGGYHVVTIHGIDEAAGAALIGDLADETIPVPLPALALARGRIKKFKNRLLALEPGTKPIDLPAVVRSGIQATVDGLTKCKMKNFRLDAFALWAERLDGGKGADSWEKIFRPGHLLYQGLWSISEFIEHYGTGGGLARPIFAEFLEEAGAALDDPALSEAARRYAELGRGWSALADAALPDDVPALRETKALLARRAEHLADGAAATADVAACWSALREQGSRMKKEFPLDEAGSAALRREIKRRVTALYQDEVAALDALGQWL